MILLTLLLHGNPYRHNHPMGFWHRHFWLGWWTVRGYYRRKR